MATGTWTMYQRAWARLWSNPNPTSNFAEQTIHLDLSNYAEVKLVFRYSTDNNAEMTVQTAIPSGALLPMGLLTGKIVSRLVVGVTSTGVEYSTGRYYTSYGSITDGNQYGIPLYIYAR